MNELVNDVHSRLNPTAVADVIRPRSLDELQAAVARGAASRASLALCGGRHAMGGQQFRAGGVLLDTSELARVLTIDQDTRLAECEAGIQWPTLIDALADTPWTIRQKQAGADDFSLGGSVSANIHGRCLARAPLVADVERLVLVGPDGEARTCSRDEGSELFGLACGGYGLFGAIYSVTLRLERRRKLERVVELAGAEELTARLDVLLADGHVDGDVRLEIDPASPGFLRRGVLSSHRPVEHDRPLSAPTSSAVAGDAILRLVHTDKARAFELVAEHDLAASGQVTLSDRHHLVMPSPDGHWPGSSEMLTEVYVTRPALAEFLVAAGRELRARDADIVGATVRLVEREDETLLAWAREPWACVELELHVEHDAVSVGQAADTCRALIDAALAHGGSYSLGYHRWARRDQLEAAYPRIHELVREKRAHDPTGLFTSDWYRHLVRLLDVREAA